MSIKLDLPKVKDLRPRLTVIGVGGAGGNAVNNMIASGLSGVSFIVANTDAQSLANSSAERRLQLGADLTDGLGAGARPEIGRRAAEETLEEIRAAVAGSHMVFIAAGMGGGTGTGAAAVVARIARESGALTVAVVTKPFMFEGTRRMRSAEAGIADLRPNVDTMIVIPNQNLFRIANDKTTFADAFVLADHVLYAGVACIVDLIVKDGLINLDFADVRAVMEGMGAAMMGTGEAAGEQRAVLAAQEAIANPLLDDISLSGAKGLLLSITGGRDMTLYEVDEAANCVRDQVDPEANIIVGATFDEAMGDRIRVSIVASGMSMATGAARPPAHASAVTAQVQSPVQPQTMAEQAASPQPPVLPPSVSMPVSAPESASNHRPHDQLTRALAEAFGAGDAMAADALNQPVQPVRPSSPVPGQHQPVAGQQQWQSASGAMFEDAPPRLQTASAPEQVRQPQQHVAADESTFTAEAPAEVRRGLRRLPEVEDFPAVGQRDYRAKAEQYAVPTAPVAMQRPPAPQPVRTYPEPAAEPPRKLSFLERLTGAKRRAAEAPIRNDVHAQVSSASPRNANPPLQAGRTRDSRDGGDR